MTAPNQPTRKLSRQQLRALEREKRDADGWIAALQTDDPWMKQSIRKALGNRRLTRAELEEALGMSLAHVLPPPAPEPAPAAPAAEPDYITFQHILISFSGKGTSATRTESEARTLAESTFKRAKQGEDFSSLAHDLSDAAAPGIYHMSNFNVSSPLGDDVPRDSMIPAIGDIGFKLGVGDIAMTEYDQKSSPYGWHIIKRLE